MEITIYEDEHGLPRVQVIDSSMKSAEEVAKIYKTVKKELKKEDKE